MYCFAKDKPSISAFIRAHIWERGVRGKIKRSKPSSILQAARPRLGHKRGRPESLDGHLAPCGHPHRPRHRGDGGVPDHLGIGLAARDHRARPRPGPCRTDSHALARGGMGDPRGIPGVFRGRGGRAARSGLVRRSTTGPFTEQCAVASLCQAAGENLPGDPRHACGADLAG